MKYGYDSRNKSIFLFLSDYEIDKGLSYLRVTLEDSGLPLLPSYFLGEGRGAQDSCLYFPIEYQEIGIGTLALMMQAYEIENNLDGALSTLAFIKSIDPNYQLDHVG